MQSEDVQRHSCFPSKLNVKYIAKEITAIEKYTDKKPKWRQIVLMVQAKLRDQAKIRFSVLKTEQAISIKFLLKKAVICKTKNNKPKF